MNSVVLSIIGMSFLFCLEQNLECADWHSHRHSGQRSDRRSRRYAPYSSSRQADEVLRAEIRRSSAYQETIKALKIERSNLEQHNDVLSTQNRALTTENQKLRSENAKLQCDFDQLASIVLVSHGYSSESGTPSR